MNPLQMEAGMFRSQITGRRFYGSGLLIFLLLLFFSEPARGFEAEDCLECHDRAVNERHLRYDSNLVSSIHAEHDCLDCHVEIDDLPHSESLAKVECGDCHENAAEEYRNHGLLKTGNGGDVPVCADCHGKHDILAVNERDSRVSPLNLARTCGKCHEDLDLTKRHDLLDEAAVSTYEGSVHGLAAIGGAYSPATCNDCHAMGGTAHNILDAGDPKSPVNHFNIPNTCGQCHRAIAGDYWEGIHGQETKRGRTDSPVCTSCHGEHGIVAPSNPDSRVSKMRLAEATCSPCHESASLNEKFDLKGANRKSWVDSYHGMKSSSGDLSVANCASCHGVHRILPQSDSTSSIHPDNLVGTCGHCHADITPQMARTMIHGVPGEEQNPLASALANFYVILIILVVSGMVLYCLIDLRKQIKSVVIKKQVIRMFPGELAQHYALMISFTVLVVTGFALRFSDAYWVQWLFGFEGGYSVRGLLHRIAAVILIVTSVWHIIYLFTKQGKNFLKDMLPKLSDLLEFKQMIFYNLGMSQQRPQFGRFSYVEKIEYWAVIWGTVIMVLSGIAMWYQSLLEQWLPKGFFDIMLVFHYYEAWLATLSILIWHLYSTVYSPSVYPMNPAWIHGRMSGRMFHHEHPGAIPRKEYQVEPLVAEKEAVGGAKDGAKIEARETDDESSGETDRPDFEPRDN